MPKPWLFLDVDGVVSPILDHNRRIPTQLTTWPTAPWGLHVDRRLPEWAADLDERFEVRWCTSWGDMAPQEIGRPLGLPEWAVLELNAERDGRSRVKHKAAAIGQLLDVDPRPFAWADDHLPDHLPPGLGRREIDHLLVRPVLRIGLTKRHLGRLVTWAGRGREHDAHQP